MNAVSGNPSSRDHVLELLSAQADGWLGDEQRDELLDLLRRAPEARAAYAEHAILNSLLFHKSCAAGSATIHSVVGGAAESPPGVDIESETTDSVFSAPFPYPTLSTTHYPLSTNFVGGPVFSYMVATVVLCVMLLGAWAYKVSQVDQFPGETAGAPIRDGRPTPIIVGRITGMKDCVWSDEGTSTIFGAYVPFDRKYALTSGLLEITYSSGARVILEGPCNYSVDSVAGGYLGLGKLTACVEGAKPQAANPQPRTSNPEPRNSSLIPHPSFLFSITTPTAIVTDLGTEFGVEVDKNGSTTSHVFRGMVRVEAGDAESVVLLENESVRVEKAGRVRETHHVPGEKTGLVHFTHPTAPPEFVRRLIEPPKLIDLLDIVAGGNGTGHRRERGINAATGWKDSFFVSVHRGGDREYRQVKRHGMIDGVFVPDGETGPVTIDSAGHAFDGFPDTTSDAFGSIWARAAKPRCYDESFDQSHSEWIYAMGDGKRFMPDGRGLLGLHPNAGITFDLAAIRRAFAGTFPSRFNAVAGMADASRLNDIADGMADFWVLVDGRLKLKRTKFRPQDGTFIVDVEIKPDDRFLTLVATDGGNTADSDWSVFGDPILRMTETDLDKQTEDRPMEQ